MGTGDALVDEVLEVRAGAVASELQMAEERPNTRVKFVKLSHFPIFEMPLQVAEDILGLDTVRNSPTLAASALEGRQDAAATEHSERESQPPERAGEAQGVRGAGTAEPPESVIDVHASVDGYIESANGLKSGTY